MSTPTPDLQNVLEAAERLKSDRDCETWPDDSPYFERADSITQKEDLFLIRDAFLALAPRLRDFGYDMIAEIERLQAFETAYKLWQEKKQWVQNAEWSFAALGMHRADVMKKEIDCLRAELAEHLEVALDNETVEVSSGKFDGWLDSLGEDAAMEIGDRLVSLGFYERQSFNGYAFYRKKE